MKLSAPPPPPPPPPEPPAPSGQPDPNAANAAPETPPEAPPPPAAPEVKPLTWPAWYPGVDSTLAALTLVFAFAAASFVARNSDVWLNLAAGKRLFAGQYTPGTDPFSYSAADRAWVNHSWLYDAGTYLLYSGNGVALVVAKALAVALAFGLLIAIRRPQFPLWPWAACACVGVLAAAPQFQLRPLVMSILFLSVTLFILFRMPHKADPKRFFIAIGVTFWLWANCDRWFFIGPLALVLLILGDLIQTKLLNSPEEPPKEGEEEPLGRLPDTATLLKALGIGVIACMLNPHHVRVWELPLELTKPAFADVDPRLRFLTLSPTSELYRENASFGYNLNGLAYVVLFLGGAVALGFGPGRVRVAHIALFVGFAALSLVTIYAMPFLAVVAVPLIAAQLNAFSARTELKSWGDPKSRLLYLGSSGGRIVSVLAIVVLCVAAYPGWVHPDTSYLPAARRVAWGVEPDAGMVAVCAQIDGWRESGQLPAETRGFVTSLELANYIAWFAPREKVFVNGRYNHHARELPDYVAARKGLALFEVKDEEPKRADATDVLRKVGAGYLAIHAVQSDSVSLWNRAGFATAALYREPGEWSPWYLDGRTTVFGWSGAPGPAFAALRVDPVRRAFGPDVRPAPDLAPVPLPLELGWEEAFVRGPKPSPVAASEALGWLRFKDGPTVRSDRRRLVRERLMVPLFFGAPATAGTLHSVVVQGLGGAGELPPFPPTEKTDGGPTGLEADAGARRAAPLLALRAARQAIAKDPDHPDGYFALYLALGDAELPLSDGERTLGQVTALRQCLNRMPRPDRYKRGQYLAPASEVALTLAATYLGRPIPGPPDPKTKAPTTRGFFGMALDVPPLNLLLAQVVCDTPRAPQAPVTRLPFAAVQVQGLPQSLRPLNGLTPHVLALDTALETLALGLEYLPLDATGGADEVMKFAARLEAERKEVQDALVQAGTAYDQAKARGADLPTLVDAAYRNGLTAEAYRLLNDKDTDVSKAYKGRKGEEVLVRVSLELVLGNVGNAHVLLEELDKPENAAAVSEMKLTPLVRLLKYQKALAAGEYKLAGDLRGDGQQVGIEPLMAAVAENKIDPRDGPLKGPPAAYLPWPPVTLERLYPVLAFQAARERSEIVAQAREQIAAKLDADARYFHQRGVLSLLEGDVRAAKRWFEQSSREPPAGWDLGRFVHPDAPRYLRLIELAEKKAAGP